MSVLKATLAIEFAKVMQMIDTSKLRDTHKRPMCDFRQNRNDVVRIELVTNRQIDIPLIMADAFHGTGIKAERV